MSAAADLDLMRREHAEDVRARGAPSAARIRAHLQCDVGGCPCQSESGSVHCPAHDDESPSLSVNEVDGKVLVHCQVDCSQREVIAALIEAGLWPKATRTEYPVKDEKGKVVATQVVR